jgi:hypothetical protein
MVLKKRDGWYSKSEMEGAQKARWRVLKKRDGGCSKSEMEGAQKARWNAEKGDALGPPN